jgi:hypothetical protein
MLRLRRLMLNLLKDFAVVVVAVVLKKRLLLARREQGTVAQPVHQQEVILAQRLLQRHPLLVRHVDEP